MTKVDGIKHGSSSGYVRSKCRCDECKVWKSTTDRAYRIRMADDLKAKKRVYAAANRDAISAKASARRQSMTPEQRDAANAYHRAWSAKRYANGRPRTDATKARRKQRDAERRDEIRAIEAAYRAVNAQKRRDWEAARRARIQGADVRRVTAADWLRVLHHYDHQCAYCGSSGGALTQDHVIPLARGGRHAIGNLIPACGSCNSSKNDRLLIEWRSIAMKALAA